MKLPNRLFNGAARIDWPCLPNARRIDMAAVPMVVEINRHGMLVDPRVLADLDARLQVKMAALAEDISTLAGRPINPGSFQQVGKFLFEDLRLEPTTRAKKTSTGLPSTEEDVLVGMLAQHPAVGLVLDYREAQKLSGTYCQPLQALRGADGRVRTRLMMNVARTGRLSSETPNLQNQPTRTEEGRLVRSAFIAQPGCVLSSLDLSQIEMVWAAELSHDPVMCDVFRMGQDLHVWTACALFRLDYARISGLWARYKRGELEGAELAEIRDFELTKRLPAKTLGFAVLYGVTALGLQAQILAAGGPLWAEQECQSFIDAWFHLYHGILEWLELQHYRARRYGMVWTAFGRPRAIPEVYSVHAAVRAEGERQAGNMADQGSAADHIKLVMGETMAVVDYYRGLGKICQPVLQVHDELIFELEPDIAEEFNSTGLWIMANAVRPMSVPVKAAASVGANWMELK